MGNLFSSVKEAVTTREAAEAYGIRVNRSGMACCPFHNDKNPSMKIDKRFHCFGCGADGDVINFTALLFGLGNKEAAVKLAEDFGIPYDKPNGKRRGRGQRKKRSLRAEQMQKVRLETAEKNFFRIVTDYYHMLRRWKEIRAPDSPDGEWDSYFCEALRNMDKVEYLLDCFMEASPEEKAGIINEYGAMVKMFENRMKQYKAEEESCERKGGGSIER